MFDITKEAKPKFLRRDYPNVRTTRALRGSGWAAEESAIHIDADGKVIDDNAVHAFTRGQCHAFGLAVHKLTGFPLSGLWPKGREWQGSPGHVVAVAPDGKLLDITGHQGVDYLAAIGFHVGQIVSLDIKDVPHLQYYMEADVDAALPFARTVLEREGYGAYINEHSK